MSGSSYSSGSTGGMSTPWTTPSSPPPERPGSAVSARSLGSVPPYMTYDNIQRGLTALDRAFGQNEFIEAVAPIRMVAIGGFLAVCLFRNREATKDLDIMIDPHVWIDSTYQQEIRNAIVAAADPVHGADLPRHWINDQFGVFFRRPEQAFFRSMDQNIVVFQGQFLTVYAADLKSALEMKLRRLEYGRETERLRNDTGDAIAIVKYMVERQRDGVPMTTEECEALDHNGFEVPVSQWCVLRLAEIYRRTYQGNVGIVELVKRNGQCGYYDGDKWVAWRRQNIPPAPPLPPDRWRERQ